MRTKIEYIPEVGDKVEFKDEEIGRIEKILYQTDRTTVSMKGSEFRNPDLTDLSWDKERKLWICIC